MGEVEVSVIHPNNSRRQGIYTGIQDTWTGLSSNPHHREAVRRKYGIDVSGEGEQEPEVRARRKDTADDAPTQYVGFEVNDKGGVNRYSWVNDIELEDLENYQARRQPVCAKWDGCGHPDRSCSTAWRTPWGTCCRIRRGALLGR